MKLSLQSKITHCDLLVLPFYEGKKPNEYQGDFEGKKNETILLYQKNKLTPRIALVGLGKQNESTAETWREAGGTVMKHFKKPMHSITIVPPKEDAHLVGAFLEGLLLAHYRYETFLSDADRKLQPIQTLTVVIENKTAHKTLEALLQEILAVTEAVKSVRSMVNAPSNAMNARTLTAEAEKIAKAGKKISIKVWDEAKLKKMGMGCLVSVSNGAKEKSRLIMLEYKNAPTNKKPIVLIGKGICFDAGGLHLKQRNLEEMKYDMTGAATVFGVFQILSRLKPNLHVIGLAAAAENLLGEGATKPGDILTAYDGTTVEITNTDAEGRLVLCDTIAYAVKNLKPEMIIDIATLTGAAIVALGYELSALMSNSPHITEQLKQAAHRTHEKVWELPLEPSYKKEMKSPIADLMNYSAAPSAGTIMGGLYLEHFTKGTPWAHLDMGGSAWTNENKPYIPKGATGRNVRLLWDFLKHVS